jgi:hypothetical protein
MNRVILHARTTLSNLAGREVSLPSLYTRIYSGGGVDIYGMPIALE